MKTLTLATGTLDLDAGELRGVDGESRALSAQEQDLLRYLVERPHADVAREELLTEVMGYAAGVNSRAVDDAIKRLRAKLERVPSRPFHLVGVRGVGYRFVPLAPSSDDAGQQVRVHLGDRVVDLDRLTVTVPGEAGFTLSATEGRLIEVLLAHPGRAVPTTDLLREVWGVRDPRQRRVVDKLVYRLRSKLERDPTEPVYLRTVRGRGLMLEAALRAVPGGKAPRRSAGQAVPELQQSIVGRAAEQAALQQQLQPAGALVTVHGAAGVGKSTLARSVLVGWPGVARWADLSGCRSVLDVREALAQAMGVDLDPTQPPQRLHAALADVADLVVLVEHAEACLEAAANELDVVRRAAPAVRLVVTSRHLLGVAGEQVLRLDPLAREHAVQLLRERAAAAGVHLDADDARVALLVEHVDRVPLALELASARLRLLGLDGVMSRLERPLELFQRGAASSARLGSLRTSLSHTWSALSEAEQELLASLTVFGGAFSPEAAEHVLQPLVQIDVLDGLQRLLDFAVLRRTGDGRLAPFHGVAELIMEERGGALRRLANQSRPALLAWFAALGGTPDPFAEAPPSAYRRLRPEIPGALAAVERAGPDDQAQVACILAWVLPMLARTGSVGRIRPLVPRLRLQAGLDVAAIRLLDATYTRISASLPGGDDVLGGLERVAEAARHRGDMPLEAFALGEWLHRLSESGASEERAVHIARVQELLPGLDAWPLAETSARSGLGWIAFRSGDLDTAWSELQEALGTARMANLPFLVAKISHNLAGVCHSEGRLFEAEAFLDLARQPLAGSEPFSTLYNVQDLLGLVWLEQGRPVEAEAVHRELLEMYRQQGARELVARQANRLGTLEGQRGSPSAAAAWFEQARAIVETEGNIPWIAACRYNLGECSRRMRQYDLAQRHYEAALRMFEALGRRSHAGLTTASLGLLEYLRGDHAKAEVLLREGLAALELGRWRRQAAEVRAQLALAVSDDDEAWDLASAAVDELEAIGKNPSLVEVYARHGRVALRRQRADLAAESLARGRALAAELHLTPQSEGREQLEQLAALLETGV